MADKCNHLGGEFAFDGKINFLEDEGRWLLEIKLNCGCGAPFRFLGLPVGVSTGGGAFTDPDGLQVRLVVHPVDQPLPATEGAVTVLGPKPLEGDRCPDCGQVLPAAGVITLASSGRCRRCNQELPS